MKANEFYETISRKLHMRGFTSNRQNNEIHTVGVHTVFKRNKVTVMVDRSNAQVAFDFNGVPEQQATTLTANVMAYLAMKVIKFNKGELAEVTLTEQELDDVKNKRVQTWR